MVQPLPLQFGRDNQGYNAFSPYPSTVKYSATITTGSETHITVPNSYSLWIVSFRYFPNDVWVDVSGATAIIPVGATLASTTSELNPSSLTLSSGTKISMITAQVTADVSVVMWPVSYP
jgi:hypothetical protein